MIRPSQLKIADLKKLRHVVGVAQAGSFTSASLALGVTQSALTKSVAEIERQLGLALFTRLPRGVELTDAGSTFIPKAERLLLDAVDLMADMDKLQSLEQGTLRIGVSPAAYTSFIQYTIAAFGKIYPGVGVQLINGSMEDMSQSLALGSIDILMGAYNVMPRELNRTHLAPLHSYIIARNDHPISDDPTARDLLGYPVVMPAAGGVTEAQIQSAYSDAGLEPRPPQYVCDDFSLVRALVNATDAVAPVVSLAPPSQRFQQAFRIFQGVVPLPPQEFGYATSSQRSLSPATRAFIDILSGFLQDATE